MQNRITVLARGLVALGLIVSLGIRFDAAARHDDRTNPLPHHSGPQSGQTGLDPHDPYAPGPVETTTTDYPENVLGVFLDLSPRGSASQDPWGDQCRPGVCPAW